MFCGNFQHDDFTEADSAKSCCHWPQTLDITVRICSQTCTQRSNSISHSKEEHQKSTETSSNARVGLEEALESKQTRSRINTESALGAPEALDQLLQDCNVIACA
jgi:hypothetical protein